MSSSGQNVASAPLTREQVLDELEFLATVEHALIVECLSVYCALGYDLDASEGGATTAQGRAAADAAHSLALSQMSHLKGVNLALIDAGRPARMDRAPSISTASAAAISLDPPNLAQLQQLVTRERAIAMAVDERYARLRPAVTSDPVFDADLLGEMQTVIVNEGPTHAAAFAAMLDSLAGLAPASFLRATRREGADAFEERLLDVGDRSYGLVVAALEEQFAQHVGASSLAFTAMDALDAISRVLVQRGLLPPFT
jgi:hypothetical protein